MSFSINDYLNLNTSWKEITFLTLHFKRKARNIKFELFSIGCPLLLHLKTTFVVSFYYLTSLFQFPFSLRPGGLGRKMEAIFAGKVPLVSPPPPLPPVSLSSLFSQYTELIFSSRGEKRGGSPSPSQKTYIDCAESSSSTSLFSKKILRKIVNNAIQYLKMHYNFQ